MYQCSSNSILFNIMQPNTVLGSKYHCAKPSESWIYTHTIIYSINISFGLLRIFLWVKLKFILVFISNFTLIFLWKFVRGACFDITRCILFELCVHYTVYSSIDCDQQRSCNSIPECTASVEYSILRRSAIQQHKTSNKFWLNF